MEDIEVRTKCNEDIQIPKIRKNVSRSLWNEFKKGHLTVDLNLQMNKKKYLFNNNETSYNNNYFSIYDSLFSFKNSQKPNFEFFLSTNNIPNEPRFVMGEFENGGINVFGVILEIHQILAIMKFFVEDVRDSNNRIPLLL